MFYFQALESEGKDPSVYEFEIIETPKKLNSKTKTEGMCSLMVVLSYLIYSLTKHFLF